MTDWKLEPEEWDIERHLSTEGINEALDRRVTFDHVYDLAVDKMIPARTHKVDGDALIEFWERSGYVKEIAFNERRSISETLESLRQSMTERGNLFGYDELFYEDFMHDTMVRFVHEVYLEDFFGPDARGGVALSAFRWEDHKDGFIEGRIYHNLPMDGNVHEYTTRKKNEKGGLGDITGFCFSVERDNNHNFVEEDKLNDFLLNIADIRYSWIEQLGDYLGRPNLPRFMME